MESMWCTENRRGWDTSNQIQRYPALAQPKQTFYRTHSDTLGRDETVYTNLSQHSLMRNTMNWENLNTLLLSSISL